MNVGASIGEESLRISVPPNQRTIMIMHVPRNSLTGWADACLVATLLAAVLNSSAVVANLSFILSSAMNALITLRPPRVSSSWDMVSLHFAWASSDFLLSFFPMALMPHAMSGTTARVKRVSCQLVTIRVAK